MSNSEQTVAWILPLALAGSFVIAFFVTLNHYGMTWDEAENFYVGDRNRQFLTTGDRQWVTFSEERFQQGDSAEENLRAYGLELERFFVASRYDFHRATHHRFVHRDLAFAWPFPPIANTASAITERFLSRPLGPVGAHHAAIGLIWAVLLIVVYRFTWRLGGHVPAFVASATLAVAPRLWGPVHNNVKDVPLTALFAFTLVALHKGVSEQRARWILASGVLAGLTVGVKLNGAFVLVMASVWLLGTRGRRPRLMRRTHGALIASPFVAGLAFFGAWPYLWFDPVARLMKAVRYALDIASSSPSHVPGYALLYAIVTTPPVTLGLAVIGIAWCIRSGWTSSWRPGLLLGVWLALPIVRVSVPGVGFNDGIRQYMEYWPALAIVAGLGASQLVSWFARRMTTKLAVAAVAAVALVGPIVADVRLHPYEDTYFSSLIGGLRGAHAVGLDWATDYWGNSYLEATKWLNAHAQHDATVVAPIAAHLLPYDGLRRDITVRRELPPSGAADYLVYITREEFYPDWLERYDTERPDHTIEVSGVPVLKIYELSGRPAGRVAGSTVPARRPST